MTREAEPSIDAISLSTVDAGVQGLDGGLWTSDLGIRYLELQREAITRNVRIRRIFVVENDEITTYDESFLRITQMQRDVGIEVRMLDHRLIPALDAVQIFDFIVFDGLSVTRPRRRRRSLWVTRDPASSGPGWRRCRTGSVT